MPFCCVKLHLKKREPLLIFTPYTAFPLSMATGHNAIMLNNFAYLISWRSRFVPSSVHFPIRLPVPLMWCGERATLFRDAVPAAQGTYIPRLRPSGQNAE